MTRTIRRRALAGMAVITFVLSGASLAWACTRQPSLTISPGFGKAGSQAQVTGKAFTPGEPVEIRWNSTGGPVIGRAVGSNFTVAVTIPADASAGVYYVVATAPTTRGQIAFQVRSTSSAQSGDPAPEGGGETSGTADGSDGGSSGESGSSSATASGGSGGSGTSGGSGQSGDLVFGEAPAEAAPAPAGQATTATPASPSRSSSTAGGRSAATDAAPATAAPAGVTPVPGSDEEASVSARSATADLWSGFSAGDAGSLTAPGLDAPGSNDVNPLAYGLALLSLGVLALGLGFGAAEVGRRRVPVESQA